MKKKKHKSPANQAFVFSAVLVVVLGALPLLAAQSAKFLGNDVSQVAVGIIGFYPSAAVFEVLRILLVVATVFWVVSWPWAKLAQQMDSRKIRRVLFPLAPVVIYLCYLFGSILQYPAFFSPFLPEAGKAFVHQAAFFIGPNIFWRSAGFFACAPFALLLRGIVLNTQFFRLNRIPLCKSGVVLFLFVISLGATGWWLAHSWRVKAEPANQVRPNVLLIAVDSLRFDRIGRTDVAPSIQRMLEDPFTVSFIDHHVGVPRTFPSWVELISGKFAPKNGVRHMFPGFGARSEEFKGFVTVLRDAGYQTQVWSDFAGDIFPRFQGGFEEVNTPNLSLKTMIRLSVDQAAPFFLPILMTPPFRSIFPALKQSPAFADSAHLTSALIGQLRMDSRPWLKAIFYSTAHFPYAAPYPYYTRFTDASYSGPFRFEKNPELAIGTDSLSEADRKQVRALYDGAVHAVDSDLGRIFQKLNEKNLWDSTLIVLTADHGEDLYEEGRSQGHGEHLRGTHVLQVPLLIKFPSSFLPEHKNIVQTTRSVDVGKTILETCGLDAPDGDGVSLLPLVRGGSANIKPQFAYSETGLWFSRSGEAFYQKQRLDYPGISRLLSFDQGYSGEIVLDPRFEKIVLTAKHRSLVYGDYKIIYIPTPSGVKYELYDRIKDPENLQDLSLVDPVRLGEMRQKILSMIQNLERDVVILDDFVVPQ